MSTKIRILKAAVEVFNQKGFHQVNLVDIAKECGMSRGNLAYHYKSKVYILNDLALQMVKEVREIQSQRKGFPAFSNLTLDVRTCQLLQARYKFIFRDSSVLEHKHIRRIINIWSESSIKRNKEAFAFGVSVGNIKPELFEGIYTQLAINAWMVTYYWVAQQTVRELGWEETAEKMVWSTIIPHFTKKGKEAFELFYGKDFINTIGRSIEKEAYDAVLF